MDLRVVNPADDELRRRMELARQQGWSEDEINRSALIERSLNQQKRTAPQQQAAKTPGKREGWDAVGSAALNFLPFGSILDKAIHGEEISGGDVALEAGLSLVPFGIGKAAKLVGASTKVAGAAAKTAKTDKTFANRVTDLFKPQEESVANRVTNAGTNIRAQNRGVVAGTRPQGAADILRPQQADEINAFLDNEVKAKGSVNQQIRKTGQYQQRASDAIETAVTQDNRAIGKTGLRDLQKAIKERIIGKNGTGIAGFDPNLHSPIVDAYQRQLETITDARGLLNFKRSLDKDAINYGRNSNAPDPMREQIAKAFRSELNNKFSEMSPAAKQASGQYAKAEQAINALLKKANPTGYSAGGFASANGMGVGGRAIQNVMDKTGRLVQGTGKFGSAPLGQQAAVRGIADLFGRNQQQPADPNQLPDEMSAMFQEPQNQEEAVVQELINSGATDFDSVAGGLADYQNMQAGPQAGSSQGGMDYSSQELFNSAMQALLAGDTKSATALSNFADQAAKFEAQAAKGSGTKLNANQQKELQKFNSAENTINQIEKALKTAGLSEDGPTARISGTARNLFGAPTGFDPQARIYKSQREGYVASLAKSLGEVGSLSDTDKKAAIQLIPDLTDSALEASEKIRRLRELISSNKQSLLSLPPASGSALPDDITQLLTASY